MPSLFLTDRPAAAAAAGQVDEEKMMFTQNDERNLWWSRTTTVGYRACALTHSVSSFRIVVL